MIAWERVRTLLVIGAGPAGCAAAVTARRTDPKLRVIVIDAARFPRQKPCGGALTGGALRELDRAGLRLQVPCAVATHARLRVDGKELRVALPRPAVVVRRVVFDADLVAQVRAAGADVVEGAPLIGLRDGIARTGAGEVAFDAVVCADGAGGPSRRLLGLPAGRRAPLREAVSAARMQEDLVFDLDAGVGGYAWRFPCVDGGAAAESFGIYSMSRDAALGPALERWATRERLLGEPSAWSIRLAERGGPVGTGPALLAGEAVGIDPLAGEGIRYALWSGRIAGGLLAGALRRGARLPPLSPQASPTRRGGWIHRWYMTRLAASRSGITLALLARLAPRVHGGDARWRRIASDQRVAEALAALVSGEAPARPILALAGRLWWHRRLLRTGRPDPR